MSQNKPPQQQRPGDSQNDLKTTSSTERGGWLQFLKLIFIGPFQWLGKLLFRKPPESLPAPKEPASIDVEEKTDSSGVQPQPETEPKIEPSPLPSPKPSPQPRAAEPPPTLETPVAAPVAFEKPVVEELLADSPALDEPSVEEPGIGEIVVNEATVGKVAVDEPAATPTPAEAPTEKLSFVQRVRAGLNRGDSWLTKDLRDLFVDGVDEDVLEDLETQLLMADVGVEASEFLIDKLRADIKTMKNPSADDVVAALRAEMAKLIEPCSQPLVIPENHPGPFVLLIVGVNGVGKTTTIGKLAHHFRGQGHSVMLAAGDTFRAAAVEQLQVWGERNDIPVVAQHTGADSASVIYDALESAKARNIDVLIADTAGRLHTQDNLMDELKKVRRVLGKLDETAPHETMLVVDGGTGQNALSQAKLFNEAVSLTGLTVTKLDGTAKGGVMFALARQQALPIRFIGVGEAREDLGVFNADEFVSTLFPSA